LKAKQEAAKEISQQLVVEEEEKVEVNVKPQHTQAQQTLAASVSESDDSEEESSFSSVLTTPTILQSKVSEDVLVSANLSLPKLSDIARYETRHITKDKVETKRVLELHKELEKIANPAGLTGDSDHEKVEALRLNLIEESKKGNTTAGRILSAATSTTDSGTESPTLPAINQAQVVSKQDFEEVEKLWKENYRTLPVPTEYGSDTNGRIEWITVDTKYVGETVTLLTATEMEKQQEGAKRVTNIMPMLLLGGFSSVEVIAYLKAKLDAGTSVLSELQKEEESTVSVPGITEKKFEEKVAHAEDEKN